MFASNTSQVSNGATYIEDVFSTWLYTGNGSTQTITNGIDLAGKGGMVWFKNRTVSSDHFLFDTNRGNLYPLSSNLTGAQKTSVAGSDLTSFNSTGFSVGSPYWTDINGSGSVEASWTFRKQPKFFDVVTYTGDGVSGRQIAHNLGSTPGCIIIKCTSTATVWPVYHRSLGGTNYLRLNTTDASVANSTFWNNTDPTSTVFTVGNAQGTNQNTATYVAYLFAHNAGGFGLTGTDNVISCGSFTTDGSGNATVNLGYEPQYLLIKRTDSTSSWLMFDTMRELSLTGRNYLYANTSGAEVAESGNYLPVTATGFQWLAWAGASVQTWAYIAIRRGPMKTPTSGTSVFSPNASNAPANGTQITTNFPVDLSLWKDRDGSYSGQFQDRLRGLPESAGTGTATLYPDSTTAESSNQTGYQYWNTGFKTYSGGNNIWWNFRRAPGFFDEVCWNGTNSDQTLNHNLGVVPELLIFKPRTQAGYNWEVSTKYTGSDYLRLVLQLTNAGSTLAYSGGGPIPAAPTATQFSVGQFYNPTGGNVAYLFASCPGVSKVGSYTGNGSSQTINCGFTGGARFVMIKATSTTGNWIVFDSARGIITGDDPFLALNTTAAESSGDYIDPDSSGFTLPSATLNNSGVSYIYLAIA